jgi:hypothetical protein
MSCGDGALAAVRVGDRPVLGGDTQEALRGGDSVTLASSGGSDRAQGEGGREGDHRAMIGDGDRDVDRRTVRVDDRPVLGGGTREALRGGGSAALISSGDND